MSNKCFICCSLEFLFISQKIIGTLCNTSVLYEGHGQIISSLCIQMIVEHYCLLAELNAGDVLQFFCGVFCVPSDLLVFNWLPSGTYEPELTHKLIFSLSITFYSSASALCLSYQHTWYSGP